MSGICGAGAAASRGSSTRVGGFMASFCVEGLGFQVQGLGLMKFPGLPACFLDLAWSFGSLQGFALGFLRVV